MVKLDYDRKVQTVGEGSRTVVIPSEIANYLEFKHRLDLDVVRFTMDTKTGTVTISPATPDNEKDANN